jgi:signal transduction histidine kinase/DNA-binding NarL/FixJ family response regulator
VIPEATVQQRAAPLYESFDVDAEIRWGMTECRPQRMSTQQRIVRERRQYNQWVASQTLEDYALRYTAASARKSSFRVGNTALGPIAFLACEAIGGTLTIAYGFPNTFWAIVSFTALMFAIGLPIAYYAAKYGVDIDLLTRGAGFGYLGSTVTSLIYASFTFLLFSIEATILAVALQLLFGIPLAIAYVLSSLVVIPIAIYGISMISRMQLATQPIWLALQFLPIIYIAWKHPADVAAWTRYAGTQGGSGHGIDPLMLGMAASTLLSLLPQIGEQVDYLRFLPAHAERHPFSWWAALLTTGPGWILIGGFKLFAGSFLAVLALRFGVPLAEASQPTQMYLVAFSEAFGSPTFALVLTGIFVIVCQLKINVTNAYAGSIAWSNFFSRLTHNHPGRVVWLVFNVLLALLLMEIGIFRAIDGILRIYANFAAGWIGALTADLVINKRIGWSPRYIEFRRAYLYDINPVGVGALLLSIATSSLAYLGLFGTFAQILSPFVALSTAFIAAPLIAWATRGRYYLARPEEPIGPNIEDLRCCICENVFERSDMAQCPVYSGPICSLCCTLESRCHDACKPSGRVAFQLAAFLTRTLPLRAAAALNSRAGNFAGIMLLCNLAIGLLLALIYHEYTGSTPAARETVEATLWLVFLSLLLFSGVGAWLIVLAHENRRTAEAESARQTSMLIEEIEAHRRTDADLQRAKEVAEAANLAKTRYIVGISHEIRTPLNSIFGYAQLLERGSAGSPDTAVRVIRRSAEHLSNLIDGLLDVSKIENGMLHLSRDTVQLGEFLSQLVDMFRLQALAKGLDFHYRRPAHLPSHVYTDQKRLRQILINLLSNAIKYTERGSITLSVRYRSEIAEFEIADTGSGIDNSDLERVFEPFERGNSEGVRAIPGTGLGLTITKLLTQIMGGEVQVQSNAGGTIFSVRLLLSEVRHEIPAPRAAQRICDYSGPRQEILVADDDPQHLELLRNLLRPVGFNVLLARDGKTCVQIAAESLPQLAIVDLSLPDMSGWDLARELHRIPGLERVKILIVSANAHEYAPGAGSFHDAFLIKPIDLQALLERVGALLNLNWIREAEPAADAEPLTGSETPADFEAAAVRVRNPTGRSRHHLEDLYRLGRIGHVRGIEAKLRELELEDPVNEAFAAELRTLVSNFDLKRYMHVLEALRASG